MKTTRKLTALSLALLMLFSVLVGCVDDNIDDPDDTSTADGTAQPLVPDDYPAPTAPNEGDTVYNIIFALATVPPVLAALDSIANGNQTYAIIERGKTYNGIDSIEYFHNAGFDPASNLSTGFTGTEYNAMIDTVKSLMGDNTFFYFYAQDGTALRCASIAANAGLKKEDFHVYMCEDGTGAYAALDSAFVAGNEESDDDGAYETYKALAAEVSADFETVMSKTDNKNSDKILGYNISKAYALASLPNFTYYLQDRAIVEGVLSKLKTDSALLTAFSVDGASAKSDYKLNLKYQKISEGIAKLTEEQRADYLTLMYGQYYEDTYLGLTRAERAGESAPSNKLVFIGARHGYYPKFASDPAFGIGGLAEDATVPSSYAALDAKYKNELLFASEADYNAFLSAINDAGNYESGISDDLKRQVAVATFNIYIDYIYTFKFTYALYGADYDIILKGHPREVIGESSEWGGRYAVKYTVGEEEKSCVYDKLIDSALLAFHASDSTGKYIGMVPYGTAAENLAYLGVDIAICGLPSSTYSGYDTDVDVLFIMTATNQAIDGEDSQVKDRYLAGNLTYVDGEFEVAAYFYNTGNVYKHAAGIVKSNEMKTMYNDLFKSWLEANHPSKTDINPQGFAS